MRKCAPQAEILDYLRQCVDRYRLRPRMRFDCQVEATVFDEPAGLWRVSLASGECSPPVCWSAPAASSSAW